MYAILCRLLTGIKRTRYTVESKIMKTQTSKKKKEHNIRHKKRMLLEKQIMPISLLGQVTENTLNEKENEE